MQRHCPGNRSTGLSRNEWGKAPAFKQYRLMNRDISDFLPVNSNEEIITYQKVFDNTAIIVLTDPHGKVKYVNKKFCEVTGYDHREIVGQYIEILRSGHHSHEFFSQMYDVLSSGQVYRGEFLQKKKKGETFWEEASIYPFMDKEHKPYQYLSLGADITSFKNAMQIKDQFLMNMSHELRTPLHSLVSLSNLLAETPLSTEQNDYLENIQNATGLLMRMVEDMLDLNKIETGQIKFENKIFNPQVLINSLVKMFHDKARGKKLEFIYQYDADLPEFIIGDPFRLKQILIHLIENAIKYTPEGSITLNCKHEKQLGELSYFEFTIEDTGIGISPENLDLIQEKFQQAKMDNRRVFGGQGLGLSIVKQLIRLQNGKFEISSRENSGTRVKFVIPFKKTGKVAENVSEGKVPPEITDDLSHIKVLIAEDVDINQMVIKKHMQKFGFSAEFAENGKIALDKLNNGEYDIILMDMQMPVMDGYEAIRKIRSDFPEPKRFLPIISITASVLGEAPQKCLEAGANDYVPKPYDVSELRKKMETLVVDSKSSLKNFSNIKTSMNTYMHENGNSNNQESLIDLEYLDQLSEGDDDFSISMLSYFLDNTPIVIQEMKEYYQAKDWKALRNVAHKFKPQLTFMGIKSIFSHVETIEQSAAKVVNTDQIPELIDKVGKVCIKAMDELKIELEKLLDKNQE
jgi:PAS domain S-box-containing protein